MKSKFWTLGMLLCSFAAESHACGWAGSTRASCMLQSRQAAVAARLSAATARRTVWSDPNFVQIAPGWWGYATHPDDAAFYGYTSNDDKQDREATFYDRRQAAEQKMATANKHWRRFVKWDGRHDHEAKPAAGSKPKKHNARKGHRRSGGRSGSKP
ncbi:MAG: hypothetical protein LBF61_02840 [Azoarcus sp.]|nr:hypothetical protein [Azoarcus sp.]